MRAWIERHRACARFCFQRLHDREFLRRFLFCDCSRAIATGRERELRRVIERAPIYTGADWDSPDNFARLGVEHCHHLIVTAGKQAMMRRIEGDAAWLFARCDRPTRPRNWYNCASPK